MAFKRPKLKWMFRAVNGINKCCASIKGVYKTRNRMCRRCKVRVVAMVAMISKVNKFK